MACAYTCGLLPSLLTLFDLLSKSHYGITSFHLYGYFILRLILSPGVILRVCVDSLKKPPLFHLLIRAAPQPGFDTQCYRGFMVDVHLSVSHRWLAVIEVLGADSPSSPSVPRFNPGVVIPKTGGGYRLLSWGLLRNCQDSSILLLTLRVPTLFGILWYQTLEHTDSYKAGQGCAPYIQPRGWKALLEGYFGHFSPIWLPNDSHRQSIYSAVRREWGIGNGEW
jgi:hypothetical protein